MTYTAIVVVESNRVSVSQQFDAHEDAVAHAATYGGFAIQTPDAPVNDWLVDMENETVAISPIPPTSDDVNAERDRRKDLPVTVTVGGETFPVDCHPAGREAIDAMATAVAIGLIDPVSFRDANNVDHDLTPLEIKSMALQVMAALEALHYKARELKAMDPIPLDFTDEKYWIEDPA